MAIELDPLRALENHIKTVVQAEVATVLGDTGKVVAIYEADKAVVAPILAKINFPVVVADLVGAGAFSTAEQASLLAFFVKVQAVLAAV